MMSASAVALLKMPAVPAVGPLPQAASVLAVTARPGQESAHLGGLLYAFRRPGTSLALVCLTRGEASPLNSTCARLEAIRPWELQLAASVLGISLVAVASYRDGALSGYPAAELTERIRRAIREQAADLLLVSDPADDPDDVAVAAAACAAARQAGVPVAARTVLGASGAWTIDLGAETETARAIQKRAAAAHASQSEGLPRLTRRLDRLGGREWLRWLVTPCRMPEHDKETLSVGGDQFAKVRLAVPADPAARAVPGGELQHGGRYGQHRAPRAGQAVPADAAASQAVQGAVPASADDQQVTGTVGHADQDPAGLAADHQQLGGHVGGQAAERRGQGIVQAFPGVLRPYPPQIAGRVPPLGEIATGRNPGQDGDQRGALAAGQRRGVAQCRQVSR